MNEIYVIGHHNPDTDSIVSAMAYAALRNALGDRNYVAAHMDHISDQTQRMLDRFGFQPPRTVQNVRTQVEDLDYDTPPALNATVTMDRAWHIMREQKISAIPVINEDGTLYGTLSAGDIATYSMTTIANPRVEAVPLFNLLSVIEGRLLNDSGDLIDTVSGNVVIALPQSCENLLFGDPDNIVICGDQPDMIRRALDIGVSCLILCQTEVDPDLLENAGRTCIITTPYEASRVARLIYQASPISRPCHNEKIVCFHLSDYIDDVREVVLKSRYRCYPVLDENEKVVGTLSRYHLLRPRRKRVVLVDHQIQFTSEVRWAEDLVFNMQYLEYANVLVSIPEAGYYYVQNPQSICHTQINAASLVQNKIQVFHYYTELYTRLGIYEEVRPQLYKFLVDIAESTYPSGPFKEVIDEAKAYWKDAREDVQTRTAEARERWNGMREELRETAQERSAEWKARHDSDPKE